jgi:tetratricopeptide (TPR) repeat protein
MRRMRWPAICVGVLALAVIGFTQEAADTLDEYQKQLEQNPKSSLAHFRIGEIRLLQRNYQSAANAFRAALNGDLEPRWTQVWSYINVGKVFDLTGQRERAVLAYKAAQLTRDDTRDAQKEAARYLETPYPQK